MNTTFSEWINFLRLFYKAEETLENRYKLGKENI